MGRTSVQQQLAKQIVEKTGTNPQPRYAVNSTRAVGGKVDFTGYVRCELSRSERDELKAWAEGISAENIVDFLTAAADSGYKLTLVDRADAFMASLMGTDPGLPSAGMILTAYGKAPQDAVLALMYKHEVLLERDWSNADSGAEGYR